MVRMNTVIRFLCTLMASTALTLPVFAQSEFFFPRVSSGLEGPSAVTLSNPSSLPAEVEFELFQLDGELATQAVNPVRYEIGPRSVLSMAPEDIFASADLNGWIRATGDRGGLTGRLLSGAGVTDAASALPLSDQLVVIADDLQFSRHELRVVNTSAVLTPVNLAVFGSGGGAVAAFSLILDAHAGVDFDLTASLQGIAGPAMVRITSAQPVAVQAALVGQVATILTNGQPASTSAAALRVVPDARIGDGFASRLLLANPAGQALTVTATVFDERGTVVDGDGSLPNPYPLRIPANGTVSVNVGDIFGRLLNPRLDGWIRIDSPNVPLGGLMVVAQPAGLTLQRLQTGPQAAMLYPNAGGVGADSIEVILANPSVGDAEVAILALDEAGNTVGAASTRIAGNGKGRIAASDLMADFDPESAGVLVVSASVPLYGAAITAGADGRIVDGFEADGLAVTFEPEAALSRPSIRSVRPALGTGPAFRPGGRIQVVTQPLDPDSRLVFGGSVMDTEPTILFGISVFNFELPLTPGIFDIRIRAGDGGLSEPYTLLVWPSDPASAREVIGRAFYEKIDVGPAGLELDQPVMVPIRGATVEVFSPVNGDVLSIAASDMFGRFRVPVPIAGGYAVRILSRSLDAGITVLDNTRAGATYVTTADIGFEGGPVLIASDSNRGSGAFNILEVVRRGNAFIRRIDRDLSLPELSIFWSPFNSPARGNLEEGRIGGTFFNASNNTAFVLGDRMTDSDEFDDDVILHEYAHLIAAWFSRDDSVGGSHLLGDILDPRVAWSEGWANFFSALVQDDPIYRDSSGPNGGMVLEHDLEENVPAGDRPGYRSEFSVHSTLWDLVDEAQDQGDQLQIAPASMWDAFVGLRQDSFVYVASFLDRLALLRAEDAFGIEQVARARSIDYFASADPSISIPFPQLFGGATEVSGDVDSLSRRRANLAQSAHHYAFEITEGAVSLRLDITGLGPGDNPGANDLDLFLMDSDGRVLARSDRGLNGQSELISTSLPPGRYVVEIRSYYTEGESGTLVFNSGSYRLQIRLP